jgi:uncharacterized membrane protein YczE
MSCSVPKLHDMSNNPGATRTQARRAVAFAQLLTGLLLFGVSVALLLRSRLGLDPWDVLHQGIARQTGLPIGVVVIGVSVLVLAMWIPLRQRPGIGTLCNAVLVGLFVDATLDVLPQPSGLGPRISFLVGGVLANGVATGLYVGAGLGPGARDGLMTGLAARGYSMRLMRTAIEVVALLLGWALGGTVGLGTLLYAVTIGPLAQFFISLFTFPQTTNGATSSEHQRHH